jgi:transcriptional regulator with XRE-family HTH domain
MRKAHSYTPQTTALVKVLGLEIARARRLRRWSQEELAQRAGISALTLSSIERGATTVAVGTVFEVAHLVGLDLLGARPDEVPDLVSRSQDRLALLPARVRSREDDGIDDNF